MIRVLEKKDLIHTNITARLKPSASKPSKLYGLSAIHNKHFSYHLVVSCIDSLTYHLAEYVHTLISPQEGETSSFIRNTPSFVDSIENVPPTKRGTMSFDMKSFFTILPIQKALGVIQGKLLADELLGERRALSLSAV